MGFARWAHSRGICFQALVGMQEEAAAEEEEAGEAVEATHATEAREKRMITAFSFILGPFKAPYQSHPTPAFHFCLPISCRKRGAALFAAPLSLPWDASPAAARPLRYPYPYPYPLVAVRSETVKVKQQNGLSLSTSAVCTGKHHLLLSLPPPRAQQLRQLFPPKRPFASFREAASNSEVTCANVNGSSIDGSTPGCEQPSTGMRPLAPALFNLQPPLLPSSRQRAAISPCSPAISPCSRPPPRSSLR
jgi:hypothetical protein